MPSWIQHLLVSLLVGGALAYLLFGLVKTLRGKKGAIGNCCAKGCGTEAPAKRPEAERIVFMPSEMLGRRKK
jgi:hypothetical protein